MGTYGIEIEILSTTRAGQLTWVMMCRGDIRHVDEVLVPMAENISCKELITEKAAETVETCSEDRRQSCDEETHAPSSKYPETVCYTQSTIPIKEGIGR